MIKCFSIAALTACALAAPAAAFAQDAKSISLAGLDLASPTGHAEALRRIALAANSVCLSIPPQGMGHGADVLKFQACVKNTTEDAVARLPQPVALANAR